MIKSKLAHLITGAKVEAKVLQQRKNKTILVFKKEEDKILKEKMDIDKILVLFR